MCEYKHIPVMLEEAISGLNIKPNGIYVDATLGGAGHASEILKRLNNQGHLYCFDQDEYAIQKSHEKLSQIGNNFTIIKDNFVNLKEQLNRHNITYVDGVLYDLGVSSFQLDIKERGFSYHQEAKLDMRMDQSSKLTAEVIVNTYSYEELKKIFYQYGEERFAPQIAKKIVNYRQKKRIETTVELAEIIKEAVPAFARRDAHPARQVFQALRIAVNDELRVFEKSLNQAIEMLNYQGRIVVITFHSLEDRICKQIFNDYTTTHFPAKLPIKDVDKDIAYRLVNKKVITPTKQEIDLNPRARSAKLRIIERIKEV